jgi:hypothetical protein
MRRAMNTVIFGKLSVGDGELTAHELTEMAEADEADRAGHTSYRRNGSLSGGYEGKHRRSPLPEERAPLIV